MAGRKGFTLIELLIVVVIIGILAAIAVPKFANTKQKAILATMKTDLRNLATAQEGHYFNFSTYASAVGAVEALGTAAFQPTSGNVLQPLTNVTSSGYTAVMTNPGLVGAPNTCGLFVGPAGNSPNAAVTQEGSPACW
ncbi:MAG: type IV pilin protein [Gemmatimonadales bacterium]